MAKILNTGLQLGGEPITRGGVKLVALLFDSVGDVLWGKGATVPSDSKAGFAVGCEFIDTTGGANVTLYVNEGSTTSCDFNAAVNN
jgi:hypothetical protein